MKNSQKIAYCAVFSALATVFLIIGSYTGFGFTAGLLASVCVVANAIAFPKGVVRSIVCFAVSTVVAGFVAPVYLQILPYALLFAPLCLTKLWVDKSNINSVIKWIIKIAVFEIFFTAYMLIYRFLFFDAWQALFRREWVVVAVVVLGQIAFVIYQFVFDYIFKWLHGIVSKYLNPKN